MVSGTHPSSAFGKSLANWSLANLVHKGSLKKPSFLEVKIYGQKLISEFMRIGSFCGLKDLSFPRFSVKSIKGIQSYEGANIGLLGGCF